MIAIITLLTALPLGALLRSRPVAFGAYAALYLWGFVFQSVYLLLHTMSGGTGAFDPDAFPLSYGLVAGGIFAGGMLLVFLGRRIRRRTITRTEATPTAT